MKVTLKTLKAGQKVSAGYATKQYNGMYDNVFVGFKLKGTTYNTLQELKSALGAQNLRDLEAEAKRLYQSAHVVAQFEKQVSPHYTQTWNAYLRGGSFRCSDLWGYRLSLASAEPA